MRVSKYGSLHNLHREPPCERGCRTAITVARTVPWADQSPSVAPRPPPLHMGFWWRPYCFCVDDSFFWTCIVGLSTNLGICRTEYSLFHIERLPMSHHYNYMLVVVDKFSRYSHFTPLVHPFTALTFATSYMKNIYKLHGMSMSIVSDRDRIFTGNFCQELFNYIGHN